MNINKIHNICKEYNITNYIINSDLSIDVNNDVILTNGRLDKLPLNFNRVSGSFYCGYNNLTSLEGCPKEVGHSLIIESNKLISLEGCPKEVFGYFRCSNNMLTSLKGCPDKILYISCGDNHLESLEGIPSSTREIYCNYNKLYSFKGLPEYFEGDLSCIENPIYEIYKLFNFNTNCINWLNEYDVIKDNNIIMDRLEEVFIQLGIVMPEIKEVEGYNLIW